MVGDVLQKDAATKIVHNLAILDHPWQCPHGRPTMGFLFDLTKLPPTPTAPTFATRLASVKNKK